MRIVDSEIIYEVGDIIQANLHVAFRYQCKTGRVILSDDVSRGGLFYFIEFDDPQLSNLWLSNFHLI